MAIFCVLPQSMLSPASDPRLAAPAPRFNSEFALKLKRISGCSIRITEAAKNRQNRGDFQMLK
jgi:hypothetical protein